MSQDLHCECGVTAMYWLAEDPPDRNAGPVDTTPLVPGMLIDLHNCGQLASGISTFDPDRAHWVNTYKDVGTGAEVFRTSHPGKHRAILQEYAFCATAKQALLQDYEDGRQGQGDAGQRRRRPRLAPQEAGGEIVQDHDRATHQREKDRARDLAERSEDDD